MSKNNVLLDISNYRSELSQWLKEYVKSNTLPTFSITDDFVESIILAVINDTVSRSLYYNLKVGRIDNFSSLLSAHIKAAITVWGLLGPSTDKTLNAVEALRDYHLIGERTAMSRLCNAVPYHQHSIIFDMLELMDNWDSENGEVENYISAIEDMDVFTDMVNTLSDQLKTNAFDLWLAEKVDANTVLVTNIGDWRILEWERDHLKNGDYRTYGCT